MNTNPAAEDWPKTDREYCAADDHLVCKGQAWTVEGFPACCACWLGGHRGTA